MNNLLYALFGFEKNRSKTYLFLIVTIHVCIWGLFFLLPFFFYPVRFDDKTIFIREVVSKIFLVGIFYLNYYVLLPRFFAKKKYFLYFSIAVSLVVIAVVQDLVIRERVIRARPFVIRMDRPDRTTTDNPITEFLPFNDSMTTPSPPRPPGFESRVWGVPRGIFFMSLNSVITFSFILFLIGGLIRLGYSFIKNQNEKKVLENANLNAEINFLRSQINPHFLFNTLNGIYSLAHEGSERTKDSILKLSDLLRYVLYDSADEKVPLSKDIQYLTNYIDLQRLRLSSKVFIDYRVEGNIQGNVISPLLLIAFIENAFKHGISYTHSSIVRIYIKIFEKKLTLYVENPIVETNNLAGGLGLKNVTRRLELLYPGHHSLEITQKDRLNIVNLKIDLK